MHDWPFTAWRTVYVLIDGEGSLDRGRLMRNEEAATTDTQILIIVASAALDRRFARGRVVYTHCMAFSV